MYRQMNWQKKDAYKEKQATEILRRN